MVRLSKQVIAESQENTLVACNHTEKIGGYIWFALLKGISVHNFTPIEHTNKKQEHQRRVTDTMSGQWVHYIPWEG